VLSIKTSPTDRIVVSFEAQSITAGLLFSDISDIELTTSLQETGTEEEGESPPLVHFLYSQTGGIKPRLSML
jgi:hypothetical protein